MAKAHTIADSIPRSRTKPVWRGLYRFGAASAALYVLMIIVPIVLLSAAPQPPLSGGAALLDYIAAHKLVYMAEYISFVGLCVPAMVVFLALYAALKEVDQSYAALGALLGIASEITALAYNNSPPSLHTGLVYLSDHYTAATTDAQRVTLATAAEALMAASNTLNPAGIVTALGILIISLVMFKCVSLKVTAYLGIATGTVGMVCEILRDLIGPGYVIYGLLLPTWFIAVGWHLYRLSEA